jgi:hypothetical protein
MNTRQGSPAAEDPVVVHQVAFLKTQDDGRMAVFQAKIGDIKKIDEPVLELTAILASPAGDEKASQEIQKFLSEVRAGFAVTALNPDGGKDAVAGPSPEGGQGESQDPDEFDINDGALFTAELIRRGPGKGPVRVTVAIRNTLNDYTWEERIRIALADIVLWVATQILRLLRQPYKIMKLPGSVAYKQCHQYTAIPAQPMPATVTPKAWCVKVRADSGPWSSPYCKGARHPGANTAEVVTVMGDTLKETSTYTVTGDFQISYLS